MGGTYLHGMESAGALLDAMKALARVLEFVRGVEGGEEVFFRCGWVGGWVGGWNVDRKVEEIQAVGVSCFEVGFWVGGWVEEEKAVWMSYCTYMGG